MNFLKQYLEGSSMHQWALATGMDYRHTAEEWAGYIHELFCQYVFDKYTMTITEGVSRSTIAYLAGKLNIIKASRRVIEYGFLA